MPEAWNKERNEFFLRDLNCMKNSSLAFLADKVGIWECFFFWRSHCQRKSQRDLYFSHLHSFRVLAAFVILVYIRERQVSPATQASLTEPRRDTWHAWSFTCTTASYVQLYQVSHFNTAMITRFFFCLVTQSSSSVKNGCVEKDYARISSD